MFAFGYQISISKRLITTSPGKTLQDSTIPNLRLLEMYICLVNVILDMKSADFCSNTQTINWQRMDSHGHLKYEE